MAALQFVVFVKMRRALAERIRETSHGSGRHAGNASRMGL